MNHQQQQKAIHYLPLFLSVIFIGTSGTLGRLITISPVSLIFLRSVIALVLLVLVRRLSGKSIKLNDRKKRNFIMLSAVFLAIHWILYFSALQLSSVALAMLSMFTYPVITVILEPFYLKKKLKPLQLPVALVALTGIYIMMPNFDIKNHDTLGIVMGLLSAFFYALRNLMLKKHAEGEEGIVIISHQLAVVTLITFPLLFFFPVSVAALNENWYYLTFLAVVTTAMGHSFFVQSLQYFSVSTMSILSNFTPVVGILLGIILLNEKPSGNIIIGGSLILITALTEVWLGMKRR